MSIFWDSILRSERGPLFKIHRLEKSMQGGGGANEQRLFPLRIEKTKKGRYVAQTKSNNIRVVEILHLQKKTGFSLYLLIVKTYRTSLLDKNDGKRKKMFK